MVEIDDATGDSAAGVNRDHFIYFLKSGRCGGRFFLHVCGDVSTRTI